jgi:Ferritin-like
VPRGQDFATQGHLYRSIEKGFARLARKLGEDRLFIGPAFQQADEAAFGWPDLGPITGLEGANRALERIVEQGEGATGDWAAAHYGRFLEVLEDYLAMRETGPEGGDVVAAVSAALGRMALDLTAHVEAV